MKDVFELVYLVDDEEPTRKALARLLRSHGLAVEAFSSALEFLAANRGHRTACLVLDVSMPGLDGFEVQRRLAESGSWMPVVFLTGRGDISMGVRAMKAGAVDFLTKPVVGEDLIRVVRAALDSAASRAREWAELDALAERVASLTPREREVMDRVLAGRLNKQIAAELGTGEQNIKLHRAHLMRKIGVRSVAELARLAAKLADGR